MTKFLFDNLLSKKSSIIKTKTDMENIIIHLISWNYKKFNFQGRDFFIS